MRSLETEIDEVAEACQVFLDAHASRAEGYEGLTLTEAQELAVLQIRIDDLNEARALARR